MQQIASPKPPADWQMPQTIRCDSDPRPKAIRDHRKLAQLTRGHGSTLSTDGYPRRLSTRVHAAL